MPPSTGHSGAPASMYSLGRESGGRESVEPELDLPQQPPAKRRVVLESDVAEASAALLDRVLEMPPDAVWTAEERQKAEAWRDKLRLSLEEAKEREAATAVQLAFDDAVRQNLNYYSDGVRMLFDMGQNAIAAKSKNSLRDLRSRNRRVMFPRPPAFLGRLPLVGAPMAKVITPTTADYRIQLGMAEWPDELVFSLADTTIELGEANVIAAVIPGGTVMKVTNVKFGRSMTERLSDGYRNQRMCFCLLVPEAQDFWVLSFTATDAGSVTRVTGVDPTVALIYSRAIPADARALAYASGMLSGGVTGPNQLVTLAQGVAAAPEGLELTRQILHLLLLLLACVQRRWATVRTGSPPAYTGAAIAPGFAHPGSNCDLPEGPGFKVFADACQLIFEISRGFPVHERGYPVVGGATARCGAPPVNLCFFLDKHRIESVDRATIVVKREEVAQAVVANLPFGDGGGGAGNYARTLTHANPAITELSSFETVYTALVGLVGQSGCEEQLVRAIGMVFTLFRGKPAAVWGNGGYHVNAQMVSAKLGAMQGVAAATAKAQAAHDAAVAAIVAGGPVPKGGLPPPPPVPVPPLPKHYGRFVPFAKDLPTLGGVPVPKAKAQAVTPSNVAVFAYDNAFNAGPPAKAAAVQKKIQQAVKAASPVVQAARPIPGPEGRASSDILQRLQTLTLPRMNLAGWTKALDRSDAAIGEHYAGFTFDKAVICHSTPRLLAVCVPLGHKLMAFVVGHALTSAAAVDEIQAWWTDFDSAIRRLPRHAIPFVLLDANARVEVDDIHTPLQHAGPTGENAVQLLAFAQSQGFDAGPLFDCAGKRHVTWTAPNGTQSQIDYVLIPEAMRAAVCAAGLPTCFVDPLGFDHTPLQLDLCWHERAQLASQHCRLDVDGMRTERGKQVLDQIFSSAPMVAWSIHPDSHLQLLNDHLYTQLCLHFPMECAKPRCNAISALQWQAIRQRRYTRRLMFRARCTVARHVLWRFFNAWERQPQAAERASRRVRAAAMQQARLTIVLRQLNSVVRKLARTDAAMHARKERCRKRVAKALMSLQGC